LVGGETNFPFARLDSAEQRELAATLARVEEEEEQEEEAVGETDAEDTAGTLGRNTMMRMRVLEYHGYRSRENASAAELAGCLTGLSVRPKADG
jgi:hypothetical protein